LKNDGKLILKSKFLLDRLSNRRFLGSKNSYRKEAITSWVVLLSSGNRKIVKSHCGKG